MSNQYRNNHYVPQWYQKKFLLPEENQLYYLDLNPGYFTDPRGVRHPNKALKHQGPRLCFCERDLYTRRFGSMTSTEIESRFFGDIDTNGRAAVDYFETFDYPLKEWGKSFENIMLYMSTQKLRIPKGLDWLKYKAGTSDKNAILSGMIKIRGMYCAIWTECIWLLKLSNKQNTIYLRSGLPLRGL